MKYCNNCGKEKDLNCFSKDKRLKYGVSNCCRECKKEKRDLNKESINKYMREYREKNLEHLRNLSRKNESKEENKIKKSLRNKKARLENIEKFRTKSKNYYRTQNGRFTEYKRRAKRSGFDFDLSFEQFISFWQQDCVYCKSKIESIGIDRVDNTKGYFLSNCVSCCEMCNKMKYTFSYNDWINHLKKIINYIDRE